MSLRAEGSLLVDLRLASGVVAEVRLGSQRPAEASRVLEGQPLDRALATAPLLWSICSTAHSVAALSAVEAALGVDLPAPQRAARDLLTLAEEIDNHAWQLCLEWPRLAGRPPAADALKAVRALTAALRPALFGAQPWRALGGVRLRPDVEKVRALATSLGPLLWPLGGGDPLPQGFAQQCEKAAGADSVTHILFARALAFERSFPRRALPAQLLPALPSAWFDARAGEPALSRSPVYQGAPAETGALSRVQHLAPVAEALAAFGPGTVARLAARLWVVNGLPRALGALADGLAESDPVPVDLAASGRGAGVVETSRGQLAHLVAVADGKAVRWRTVAPTEWNFHPDGPLARTLLGAPAEGLAERAALAVTALDPCVGYELRVAGGG